MKNSLIINIIFWLFVTQFNNVLSQKKTIEGTVKDALTGEAMEQAHIKIQGIDKIILSRKSGQFSYESPGKTHILTITYVGYDTLKVNVNPKDYQDKKLEIKMISKSILLDPGIIFSEQLPDTIFESEEVSVHDFIFDGAALILLTYDKTPKRGTELWWVDEHNQPISKYPVPGKAEELVYNYKKEPLLLCEETVYQIKTSDKGLQLFEIPKTDYKNYIQPVVGETEEALLFTTFSEVYPAFKYMSYEQEDSLYDEIIEIEDEFMMEHYRAEFKFTDVRTRLWAYQQQLETGIDKEIWVGATIFTQTPYYKELYAPLFKRNDTIVVFDHYSDHLYLFDDDKNPLDSIPINYHEDDRKTGWQRQLIQDEMNGKIHAVFEKNGYTFLKEIDLKSGETSNIFKLHFRYVERIRIFNSEIFYIYRPYESIQKKFLYREIMK